MSMKTTASSISSSVHGVETISQCHLFLISLSVQSLAPQFSSSCLSFHDIVDADATFNFRHVLTGSYHNYFTIFDSDAPGEITLEADKSAFKAKRVGHLYPGTKRVTKFGARHGDALQLDYNKKILHTSWHPKENTIAVRGLHIFNLICID